MKLPIYICIYIYIYVHIYIYIYVYIYIYMYIYIYTVNRLHFSCYFLGVTKLLQCFHSLRISGRSLAIQVSSRRLVTEKRGILNQAFSLKK